MADQSIYLEHHFENLEHQTEAATLGMWIFLVTEIVFFGGLFTSYAVCRFVYPGGFAAGSHHTEFPLGTINTVVLLLSSLTMAMGVRSARLGRRQAGMLFLGVTIVLGCVFLGIKYIEYYHHYVDHLIPRYDFRWEGPYLREAELFMCFYFFMTGLHALHMVIGVGLVSALVIKAYLGRFSPEYYAPVEVTGLYWHFVDIVWIFLYPLIYLIDRYK